MDASLPWWKLQGVPGATAEADRVIVEGRMLRYLREEWAYVSERIEEHLAATPPQDRGRWRSLYREAQISAATGSGSYGEYSPGGGGPG